MLRLSEDSQLLAAQAFTSLSLVALIAAPFSTLVQALPSFAAGLSSISRIEAYTASIRTPVQAGEKGPSNRSAAGPRDSGPSDEKRNPNTSGMADISTFVTVENGCFGWKETESVLENVHLTVEKGAFVAIVGPVGSGKTTLLHALLGQVPFSSGQTSVACSQISFCPQNPWLFTGTVRQNVVYGAIFDSMWYHEVIDACCLKADLEGFAESDAKQVGNEGTSLSGGQRQRVVGGPPLFFWLSLFCLCWKRPRQY